MMYPTGSRCRRDVSCDQRRTVTATTSRAISSRRTLSGMASRTNRKSSCASRATMLDGHVEVYTCTTCRREASQSPTYDLFDGVAPDNSFTSVGLGEPEPPQLGCLNAHERLALSVLKMCNATASSQGAFMVSPKLA
eukprot:2082190-Prymnesium_polylepis.1